jgi:cell migration-inducing and hyaluronan-binding protein
MLGDILEVTVDFTGFTELDPTKSADTCRPSSFCKREGDTCKGALDDEKDPLVQAIPNMKQTADDVCSHWAVKDLDCPKAGCLGFEVTLRMASRQTTNTSARHHRAFPTT